MSSNFIEFYKLRLEEKSGEIIKELSEFKHVDESSFNRMFFNKSYFLSSMDKDIFSSFVKENEPALEDYNSYYSTARINALSDVLIEHTNQYHLLKNKLFPKE